MGFKPKSKAIKPWYHVKNAQFIYPDEKVVKGNFSPQTKPCIVRTVSAPTCFGIAGVGGSVSFYYKHYSCAENSFCQVFLGGPAKFIRELR